MPCASIFDAKDAGLNIFRKVQLAWISWCKPSSAALSQVFGVKTGLGLFPLTFDWTQITSLNNPLTVPFWSVCCIFGSFVFWIWIVMPGLYYQTIFKLHIYQL